MSSVPSLFNPHLQALIASSSIYFAFHEPHDFSCLPIPIVPGKKCWPTAWGSWESRLLKPICTWEKPILLERNWTRGQSTKWPSRSQLQALMPTARYSHPHWIKWLFSKFVPQCSDLFYSNYNNWVRFPLMCIKYISATSLSYFIPWKFYNVP